MHALNQKQAPSKASSNVVPEEMLHSRLRNSIDIIDNSPFLTTFKHHFSNIPMQPVMPVVQTKLSVNEPGDKYELEADAMADKIMRMTSGETVQPKMHAVNIVQRCSGCDHEEDKNNEGDKAVQRTIIQRKCAECEEKEKNKKIQRKETAAATTAASSSVSNILHSAGHPMDAAIRSFMEPRFGFDFSQVRIHNNGEAATAARSIQARAFTSGNNIVFGSSEYSPNSMLGKHLLAHELTHVIQQQNGIPKIIQRAPDPAEEELKKKALALETEILASPSYKKLKADSKAMVKQIILQASSKPLGEVKGRRNYYLTMLKTAITFPFKGKESGKTEYGCSDKAEKDNKKAVEEALQFERKWWEGAGFENVEEDKLAGAKHKEERVGEQKKKFLVDKSDPRNIMVQIKVKLNGKKEEVEKIKELEDAIERSSKTEGYTLDIVFVDKPGDDVFEFSVVFCQWANSGNWASAPVVLSHEVHHALGLGDRYDYIESHSTNDQMNVPMRLVWFNEQMHKTESTRDPFSKMNDEANPLLAEDVCAVAFDDGPERKKCIDARKDLDPKGIPAI